MQILTIIFALLLPLGICFTAVNPTRNPDGNFQAGSYILFVSATSAPFTNSYTVNYPVPSASNPPALAFGIKSY